MKLNFYRHWKFSNGKFFQLGFLAGSHTGFRNTEYVAHPKPMEVSTPTQSFAAANECLEMLYRKIPNAFARSTADLKRRSFLWLNKWLDSESRKTLPLCVRVQMGLPTVFDIEEERLRLIAEWEAVAKQWLPSPGQDVSFAIHRRAA
jgi:hypothetical protein